MVKNLLKELTNINLVLLVVQINNTPYIVQKFFEIPGSGLLLLAYDKHVKVPLEKLGFVDGVNYISVCEDNLEEKINFIFDPENNELIEKIRLADYTFVNSTHTHKIRTNNFIKYLDDYKNG